MGKCEGLTGEALERCRRQSLHEGMATSRWIGLFCIVFGLVMLWQPVYFVWLVAGFLILTSVFLLIARKLLFGAIFFFGGALLFLFPAVLMLVIAAMFVVAGIIVIVSAVGWGGSVDTHNGLPVLLGVALIIIGIIFYFYPEFATTIVGLVLVFTGFILLISGYEGIGDTWGSTSEWVRK